MLNLRTMLFQDLGTKALALILALAIYVHVFSGQEREMTYRIPLSLAQLPSDLALAEELPEEVRVRVRATGAELVKLSTRRFDAQVTLDDPQEGVLQRPVLGSDVRFPHGVRPVLVEILGPRVLNVTIEPVESALLPVALRFKDPIPADRALVTRPKIEPMAVRVSGPRSVVAMQESVATEPVEIKDWSGELDLPVPLSVPAGLGAEEETVRVVMVIEEKRIRRFTPLPIEIVSQRAGHPVTVSPDTGGVVVRGAASIVDRVNPQRVRLFADLRSRRNGPQTVALRALVPGLPPSARVAVLCVPESVAVQSE